jgi:aminoglycoside phosphotransferase (APT) family kinase protein
VVNDPPVDRSELGDEPIATGRTAEIFSVSGERVVKLLRSGSRRTAVEDEAARTKAARTAGAPAPEVLGTVAMDGRHGIVFEHIVGDSLIDEVVVEPLRLTSFAKVFADVHHQILSHESDDLPPVADELRRKIRAADLPAATRNAALDVVAAAPDGSAVLHGDYHPGNVLMAPDGPIAIDWVDASRGPASADVARTLLLLSTATIGEGTPNRRMVGALQGAFRRSYMKRIRRAVRVHPKVLDAWRLPMAAARLAEGVASEEAALRSQLERWTGT